MKYPHGKIIVFCKAPEPGKVMTRLARALSEAGLDGNVLAAKLHEFLTLERLKQVTQKKLSPVELWCAPNASHPFFKACEKNFPLFLKEQPNGDLGYRMEYAFNDTLKECPYAVLIGTDCPGLNTAIINRSLEYLSKNDCSVIGPAEDGGYVLIGLSSKQKNIFKNIEWGTSHVCDETLHRLNGSVEQLPDLWDVDHLEDLLRLRAERHQLNLSESFIRFLDSIILDKCR